MSRPFLSLAEAIYERLETVVARWDDVPPEHRLICKGALAYFSDSIDQIRDAVSPIGFEDDCAVLNVCLRLIGREEFCLEAEDFDEL